MKDGSKLAQKLPQLSTLVKKLVPYVIRENVPLAYFTFSYKKNLNHTSCTINAMQMI